MDTERAIEKALRAIADGRRKTWGDGIQLHPANRRLLQGEVRGRYGVRPGRVRRWWPRLAWGFGVAAVAAVWVFLIDRPAPMEMAKSEMVDLRGNLVRENVSKVDRVDETPEKTIRDEFAARPPENRPTSRSLSETALQPVPPAQPAAGSVGGPDVPAAEAPVAMAPRTAGREFTAEKSAVAAPSPAAAPVVMGGPAPSLAGSAGAMTSVAKVATESLAAQSAPVAQEPQGVASLRADTGSVGRDATLPAAPAPGGMATSFGAAAGAGANLPDAPAHPGALPRGEGEPKVLSTFFVEQEGDRLRITDADGSVYTGSLVAAEAAAPRDEVFSRRSTGGSGYGGGAPLARSAVRSALSPQVYSFHVQGTNRSLSQAVSFTGSFRPGSSPGKPLAFTNVYAESVKAKTEAAAPAGQEIYGRFRLGTGPERTVKAVPTAGR